MTDAAEDIAARPSLALAPGWTEADVAMLQELAELAMAHARAITLELMAHAERVQIGDLTPLSRAALIQSNAGFTRAARCLRLTLTLKAQACDPNHKPSSPACGGGGPPKAGEGAATPRASQPTERFPESDRPERDIEREVERETWGARATPTSAADAITRIQAGLAGVRRHYGEGLSFEDTTLSSRRAPPRTKSQAGRIEYCVPETSPETPNDPFINPGAYPNYQAYRAACDAEIERRRARKPGRKPKSRGPPYGPAR